MIWDCLLYNGEKHCLQIRCEELKELIVTHVLVESSFTFSGESNSLKYWDFADLYYYNIKPFLFNSMPNNGNAWDNEAAQRNYIMIALNSLGAKDDDIVILSDADEIPCKEAVKRYKPYMGVATLIMNLYYYYLNLCGGTQIWIMPKIMTFGMLKNSTPNEIRNNNAQTFMHDGGWHFSYMGGVDAIKNKIESYSHTEHNITKFKSDSFIKSKIDNNEFLFDDKKLTLTEIDETYPIVIYSNQSNYSHLIKPV